MLKRIIDGLELNAYHTRSISLSRWPPLWSSGWRGLLRLR